MRTTLESCLLSDWDVFLPRDLRWDQVCSSDSRVQWDPLPDISLPLPRPSTTAPSLHASRSEEPPDTTLSQFTNCGTCLLRTQVQEVCGPSSLHAKGSWKSHRSSWHLTLPQVVSSHGSVAVAKGNCPNWCTCNCLFEVNTWHYRIAKGISVHSRIGWNPKPH